MKTILVEIAAYRDDELPKTVASLLTHAKYPQRLRFAIVHQFGPETARLLDSYKGDDRFRIHDMSWREARGVGVARRICNDMYENEDFYLQIDSHMRAQQDWDQRLENEWQTLDDKQAILSSYPPAYKYDEADQEVYVVSKPNRLVVHQIYAGFIPIFFGKELPERVSSRGSFVAGGLQFGPGRVCREVPYESRICFIGEEFVHSLRLYTAGYHVYSVRDQVLSHLYIRSRHQKNVHHFWKDFQADTELAQVYTDMNTLSLQTVRDYFAGHESVASDDLRSFENFAGVDTGALRVHAATYEMRPLPLGPDDTWRSSAIEPIAQS